MGADERIVTLAPVRPLTDQEVSAILGAIFIGFLSSNLATPATLIRALQFWQEKRLAALITVIYETTAHAEASDHAEKANG